MYARKLTKEELKKSGITAVDFETGRVFGAEGERTYSINNGGYFVLPIYELDDNGNKIKVLLRRRLKGCKQISETYTYKQRIVGLHRVIWAWKYGEVPEGYVVDHKNNKHSELKDYRLDNLQCITPAQNLAKEKPESTRMVKTNNSLEYCEAQLKTCLDMYDKAKLGHNAKDAHKYRSLISYYKAQIRYILKNNQNNQLKLNE